MFVRRFDDDFAWRSRDRDVACLETRERYAEHKFALSLSKLRRRPTNLALGGKPVVQSVSIAGATVCEQVIRLHSDTVRESIEFVEYRQSPLVCRTDFLNI
jgi:hypothetical protein